MAILILGNAEDEHAAHVRQYLQTQGADAEFLDSRDFPSALRISYDPGCNRAVLRLPCGRSLSSAEITSVYWRGYYGITPPELPDAQQAHIAQNDARSLFESMLIRLPARWVNGWQAFQLHQTKPAQLAMVAALGISVPATLLTNDPDSVREFAGRYRKCIFKPVQGGAYTRPVAARHLTEDNLRSLSLAPVTLQEEIEGTDVRVFLAGQRVLACEVQTAALDFRDDPDPHIEPIELPVEIAEQCLRIAATLHLLWTGIDLRRTPQGEFIFLEANPSPMFLGFESRSGLPLTESLAALLMGPES